MLFDLALHVGPNPEKPVLVPVAGVTWAWSPVSHGIICAEGVLPGYSGDLYCLGCHAHNMEAVSEITRCLGTPGQIQHSVTLPIERNAADCSGITLALCWCRNGQRNLIADG